MLGPLCYKLITIVNLLFRNWFDLFCLLPKSFVSVHFHCVAPFVIETCHCCFNNLNCKQIVCTTGRPIEISHLIGV